MRDILLKIIAVFWIFSGLIWLVKPEKFRRYVEKKVFKKYRRLTFALLLLVGFYFLSFLSRPQAVFKLVAILGLVLIVKSFFLLNRKFLEKLSTYLEKVPLMYLRAGALFFLALGIFIFIR